VVDDASVVSAASLVAGASLVVGDSEVDSGALVDAEVVLSVEPAEGLPEVAVAHPPRTSATAIAAPARPRVRRIVMKFCPPPS
jgi:hypothetical protein